MNAKFAGFLSGMIFLIGSAACDKQSDSAGAQPCTLDTDTAVTSSGVPVVYFANVSDNTNSGFSSITYRSGDSDITVQTPTMPFTATANPPAGSKVYIHATGSAYPGDTLVVRYSINYPTGAVRDTARCGH